MRGTLLVLTATAGAVVGAALTHSVNRVEPRVPTLSAESANETASNDAAPPERPAANALAGSTTAARAELYRVAATANARELTAMIRSAAAQKPSAARTFALDVLLARYAEMDPEAAIAAAAGLEAELRAPLHAAWAVTDPAAALNALADLDDPVAARAIAVALVPVLGDDERALRQVAAAVAFGVESSVYAEVITARAAIVRPPSGSSTPISRTTPCASKRSAASSACRPESCFNAAWRPAAFRPSAPPAYADRCGAHDVVTAR